MTDSARRFARLRARYAQSLASKHAALCEAWQVCVSAPDASNLHKLQVLVHRLSGSAPAYGYAALGKRAGAIDRELMDWNDAEPTAREGAPDLAHRLTAPMQALIAELAHHAAAGERD
ncbi:MAG TPA: hypothetical protein VH375_00400 [Rhodanobacteraceae bacterium]